MAPKTPIPSPTSPTTDAANTNDLDLECCPQSGVSAIDFVTGHPPRGYSGGHSAVDQCCRQRWFGRETPLILRDSGIGAAIMVVGPAARKIQRPIDQGVPTGCGIGQIHRDLGVLDPTRGAAVLALHPDACAVPFFTSPVSSTTRIALGSPKASTT